MAKLILVEELPRKGNYWGIQSTVDNLLEREPSISSVVLIDVRNDAAIFEVSDNFWPDSIVGRHPNQRITLLDDSGKDAYLSKLRDSLK